MPESIEVERELTTLRACVRRWSVPSQSELTPLENAVSALNLNWYVSARVPPPEPVTSRRFHPLYFFKRVARRVLYEALNPLIEPQNAFNAEVARAITALAHQDNGLDARIQELERRRVRKRG